MTRSISKTAVLLVVVALCLALGSCTPEPTIRIDYSPEKGIVYYDVFLEIDPEAGVFRSQQKVTLTGNLAEGEKLTMFLDNRLVIDELTLKNGRGGAIPIVSWRQVNTYTTVSLGGEIDLAKIVILTEEPIPADEELVVHLAYHLPAEQIGEGLASNMYGLFAGARGLHAGGPESGAFPQVAGTLSAPFSITIKHPNTWQCALPGERVHEDDAGGYTTVTYRAEIPYDPSFSCAEYDILRGESGAMQIELFIPAHLEVSAEMLEAASRTLSLYQEMFGTPPADSFRVVFPELDADKAGGESNGNIVILGDIEPFMQYDQDELAQDMFTHLMAHEGYHLWNAWALTWEGMLAEWWVEGGANFMAAWAKERLVGDEYGSSARLRSIQDFIEQEAYQHKNPLALLDDTWFEHWALVYDYGALVWEQLRQKIGDEALMAGLYDFYKKYSNQDAGYYELINCLEEYTEVDAAAYLEQWTQHNAEINLILQDVIIREVEGVYEVEAILEIDSDRDFELFSALGYKTSESDDWQLIDLHFEKRGRYSIHFSSNEMPQEILFDPEYRVPQINLEDDRWVSN